MCQNPNGLKEFWIMFEDVTPELFEENGKFLMTGFENNMEVKAFLLLLKELIPKNVASRNLIPVISKLIRTVKVKRIVSSFTY